MKHCKRMICLFLVLSILTSVIPMAFAAPIFSDVPEGKWYSENVAYVYEKGLMNGVNNGMFDPNGTLTRGMLVTVLYRMEGEPITPDTSFTDVAANKYYYGAVAWAENKGIVNGKTETTFEPNTAITRQEVATILKRYTETFGYADTSKTADLNSYGFTDIGTISKFAVDAMAWAVEVSLLNGSNGKLDPKGNATRAQIAAILNRFCENILAEDQNSELATVMAHYAEYAMAYAAENGSDSRFDLINIDSDQIPELICVPGGFHLAQVTVYTWYNGQVEDLGDYGMYGTMPYIPRENAFGDYSKPMRIVEGYASEAVEYDSSKFVEYGYGDMTKITRDNVDKILLGK